MLIRLPILSAVTVVALVPFRPEALSFRNGEEIAAVSAWALALFVALWLFVSSAGCAIALRRGRLGTARRCAALVPAVLRRGLELAIVATIAGSTLPAHALTDEPVVRTPQVASAPTTSVAPGTTPPPPAPSTTRPRPVPTTTPATTNPPASTTTTAPKPAPVSEPESARNRPTAAPPHPTADPGRATYVVRPGDNLWLIAQRTLEERDRPARELVAYWHAVIETNASTLRSGDPDLIYPGEVLTLPPTPVFGDNS